MTVYRIPDQPVIWSAPHRCDWLGSAFAWLEASRIHSQDDFIIMQFSTQFSYFSPHMVASLWSLWVALDHENKELVAFTSHNKLAIRTSTLLNTNLHYMKVCMSGWCLPCHWSGQWHYSHAMHRAGAVPNLSCWQTGESRQLRISWYIMLWVGRVYVLAYYKASTIVTFWE